MAVGDGEREGSGGDGDDDGDCDPVIESVTEAVTEAATAPEMLGEEEPLVDTLKVIATVADAATVPVKLDVWLLTAEPEQLVDGVGEGEADFDALADAATVPVTLSDALAVAVTAAELLADEEPLVDAVGSTLPVTELVEETDHETDFDGEIDGEGGAQKRSTAPGCQATTAPICAGVSAHE